MRPLDLRDLAAQLAEDWVPRALQSDMDLGFELQTASVAGQSFLLRELLENLLHNAFSYAGRSARITVRSGTTQGQAFVEIEDDGPGIPAAERERALQRFQRGSQANGQGSGLGLGLGLEIALDIAARHGGRLELLEVLQGQGLRVRLKRPEHLPTGAAGA